VSWELSQLVQRYALTVEVRGPVGALFTEVGTDAVPVPPDVLTPAITHTGRDAITAAMADLPKTFHAIVGEVYDGDSGRIACVAHHLVNPTTDLVWHLRYADSYAEVDGTWLFARRELTIELIETHAVKRSR
jgi:hypothetical protein